MDIFEKLEKLRRSHNYCEDGWYSCPKAEDGCANDSAGDDCDCGADNENKLLDEIINELRNSLKSVERNDSGGVASKCGTANKSISKLLNTIETEINKIDPKHYIVPATVIESQIIILDCISQLRE